MVSEIMIAPKNVVNLYAVTSVTLLAKIEDYTEGIYNGNPSIPHDVAQKNQHDYLLDEIEARKGFRLLDVGCGLGTLLETARERGVEGVGITISEDQVAKCKAKGLDVRLFNYNYLPDEFDKSFDGIIANGSIEHFCQPEDVIENKQNDIYREMFRIFARLLNPNSLSQKVATTTIHFRNNYIIPKKLLKNPFLQFFNSEAFHFSILHRGYGGYYPIKGQLEKCASGEFTLIKEVEGTKDYHFTADHWCREYKKAAITNLGFMRETLKHLLKRPIHTFWAAASYAGPESWPWQFRGENPPAKLYRHTWQRKTTIRLDKNGKRK